jgi:hypothetical protein
MNPHPPADLCAPYRSAPAAARPTPPPPTLATALGVGLAAVTLSVSLATLAAVRAARPALAPVAAAVAVARPPSLVEAAGELARRHGLSLYVAPDVFARAVPLTVAEAAVGGPLEPAVRALDAYAAARGLWVHDAAGVLRVERASPAAELACDDAAAACSARVERLAAVSVVYADGSAARPIHLRAGRAAPAIDALRSALEAAGLRVDAAGRTLYVSAGAPAEPAVRRLSPGHYAVGRAALDAVIDRPGELARATRILPVVRGGRTVGVRLLGVHPGDLLDRLGFESGDVLTRVNGYDVVSPDRCLEAYASVRRTDHLAVELERRGRPTTLAYVIEPG